jgi:hypothetical protein
VDWRSGSEALFQAVRADHEASAADCARVEAELARRIAAGAPAKLAPDGDVPATPAKPARLFTPGTLAKLSIGVSLLAAGSLAIMRGVELAHSRASRPANAFEPAPTPPMAAAATRERTLEPAPEAASTAPLGELPDAPLPRARTRQQGSARGALSRGALRDSAALRLASASHGAATSSDAMLANEAISPTPASVSARGGSESSRAEPAAQPTPSGDTSPQRSAAKTSAKPLAQPRPAAALEPLPEANAPSQSASQTPVRVDDSADARAELALVERIQAAMRAAKPAAALALCAEHAKRWPHGMFAEEREAVSAIAACVLHSDAAAARARLFLSQHPRAPTAPRVAAACAPLSAATEPGASD